MFYPFLFNNFKRPLIGFYYTVQGQENLETISKRYKVPAHNIIYVNNLTYPYAVKEGDRLFIPGMYEPVASNGTAVHTVKFGENLDKIASIYKVEVEELMRKNYLNNKSMTFVGQKLLIPQRNQYVEQDSERLEIPSTESASEILKDEPTVTEAPRQSSPDYENAKLMSSKQPTLKRGMRGDNVLKFQRLAAAAGHKLKRIDGNFSSEMESMVKRIQKKEGLETTGLVDQSVWEYLFLTINKAPSTIK